MPVNPTFFLGGADLEMQTIRALILSVLGPSAVRDRGLSWGAKLSDYAADLADLPPDCQPVLVELALDGALPAGAVVIDHHGPQAAADAPTSLEQVFHLLRCPPQDWSRYYALVAANDRGHIAAMRQMGASDEEIRTIRTADRHAQGITAEQEAAGRAALDKRTVLLDGSLTLVNLPHSKTAVITDPLALEANSPANLLILSPDEINFFGSGAAVQALCHTFPDGWYGGALPEHGFWGISPPLPELPRIFTILQNTKP